MSIHSQEILNLQAMSTKEKRTIFDETRCTNLQIMPYPMEPAVDELHEMVQKMCLPTVIQSNSKGKRCIYRGISTMTLIIECRQHPATTPLESSRLSSFSWCRLVSALMSQVSGEQPSGSRSRKKKRSHGCDRVMGHKKTTILPSTLMHHKLRPRRLRQDWQRFFWAWLLPFWRCMHPSLSALETHALPFRRCTTVISQAMCTYDKAKQCAHTTSYMNIRQAVWRAARKTTRLFSP